MKAEKRLTKRKRIERARAREAKRTKEYNYKIKILQLIMAISIEMIRAPKSIDFKIEFTKMTTFPLFSSISPDF